MSGTCAHDPADRVFTIGRTSCSRSPEYTLYSKLVAAPEVVVILSRRSHGVNTVMTLVLSFDRVQADFNLCVSQIHDESEPVPEREFHEND
jgi:hypothetical protein